MIAYGYPGVELEDELLLARRIGASVLEILPAWSAYPDPRVARISAADRGFAIHSAHGCWGGQTITAARVDLGSTDRTTHRESIDDLKRCIDWIDAAGGTHLVIHPGGLSDPDDLHIRRNALKSSLRELADHAEQGSTILCVENMPPGVWPGSRMVDLAAILDEIDLPRLALALDTGHAQIAANLADETRAAGRRLATTHVHDNDGRRDLHNPPGEGTVDWIAWKRALDEVDYQGPILLECIRLLRQHPEKINDRLFEILGLLTSDKPAS